MTLLPLIVAASLTAQSLPSAPAAVPSEKGSAQAGPAGLEVTWQRNWSDAVKAAKKIRDGRILIELADEECGECARMEALVVPSTSFYSFTRDKVPVRLLRSSEDGKKITQLFGIDRVPAWVVVTPELVLCGILVGSSSQTGWFETFVETEKNWALFRKKLDQEQKNPGDSELVFAVAQETYKRRGDAVAEPRFRRLAGDARVKPEIREQSLAYLASIEMDDNRIPEAARDLELLLKTGKDPKLRQRAELRLADVEIARGRKDLAAGRLRRFKSEHPDSPLLAEADELLKLLVPQLSSGQN